MEGALPGIGDWGEKFLQKSLHNTKILVSGFWSIARHLNYFGEIVQSIALSIPGFIVGESNGNVDSASILSNAEKE
jgi:steroid 5-alpha reductase family enzyme